MFKLEVYCQSEYSNRAINHYFLFFDQETMMPVYNEIREGIGKKTNGSKIIEFEHYAGKATVDLKECVKVTYFNMDVALQNDKEHNEAIARDNVSLLAKLKEDFGELASEYFAIVSKKDK